MVQLLAWSGEPGLRPSGCEALLDIHGGGIVRGLGCLCAGCKICEQGDGDGCGGLGHKVV